MKTKAFERTVLIIAVLLLVASVGALAQNSAATTFGGELNAYSPQTTGSSGTTGPYEIRGPWSLTVKGSTANFSADVNMEESDGWCISQNGSNFDPAARGAHTHHITLVNAAVTLTTAGFEVTGSATIMANGTIAAISPSVLTHRRHRWHGPEVLQYHAHLSGPGLRALWNGARTGRDSKYHWIKRQETKVDLQAGRGL
jgi:hypothetical protein